jgi:hypothetical protein
MRKTCGARRLSDQRRLRQGFRAANGIRRGRHRLGEVEAANRNPRSQGVKSNRRRWSGRRCSQRVQRAIRIVVLALPETAARKREDESDAGRPAVSER